MEVKKGDIIVRTSFEGIVRKSYHKEGYLFAALQNSSGYAYYKKQSCISPSNFRKATPAEVKYFKAGYTNIHDVYATPAWENNFGVLGITCNNAKEFDTICEKHGIKQGFWVGNSLNAYYGIKNGNTYCSTDHWGKIFVSFADFKDILGNTPISVANTLKDKLLDEGFCVNVWSKGRDEFSDSETARYNKLCRKSGIHSSTRGSGSYRYYGTSIGARGKISSSDTAWSKNVYESVDDFERNLLLNETNNQLNKNKNEKTRIINSVQREPGTRSCISSSSNRQITTASRYVGNKTSAKYQKTSVSSSKISGSSQSF